MSKTYIQLGRLGDILNILPMVYADARSGEEPTLIVSSEYSQVLDGISYCKKVRFDGPPHDIAGAVKVAESLGQPWICTQVNGPTELVREHVYKRAGLDRAVTTSFQKEQWRVAGRLADFASHPLVFDQRDLHREEELFGQVVKRKGKFLLLAPEGISSPFRYRSLLAEICNHCGYSVIDLSQVKAERFYDLLVLYEAAVALVSIDTAHIHLAPAAPQLPVLALVNDKPTFWNGSSWRGQHRFYCRYSDFPDRAAEMAELLRGLRVKAKAKKAVVHLWNAHGNHSVGQPFHAAVDQLPIVKGMVARLGPASNPSTPYLRDCLKMALQRTRDDMLLCVTGPNVQIENGDQVIKEAPCYAYRLAERDGRLQSSAVADLFCASAKWWTERLGDIPDLLFSNDYYWRHVLWALFSKHGGKDITPAITVHAAPSKAGATLSPAATHNSTISSAFIRDQRITCRYPKVTEQVHCTTFEPGGLLPFGYNPTIIEQDDMLLMAYRYHPDPRSPSTKVVLSQVDMDGAVLSNRILELDCRSGEDPKLFVGPGQHCYMSFVASSLPHLPARAVVRYCEVINGKPQGIITPSLGKNDETAIEKNWVVWWMQDELAVVYRCDPTQQVFTGGTQGWKLHETPGPKWPWGPIKGGTPPLPFDGKWLRFFHSTTDTEFTGHHRRYYVGALVMEKEPPFNVITVSRKPILYGSEVDDLRVKERPPHWKANVVFPGGAVARRDGWTLAVGVNDCQCVLADIRRENLHL